MLAEQRVAYDAVLRRWADKKARAKDGGAPLARVEHVFTELRKVANHPMLVRRRFSDATLELIIDYMHRSGGFGAPATATPCPPPPDTAATTTATKIY
eukprot:COSAG01_NODE_2608_length_7388_cov_2.860200_6_plen_98_part_00